MLVCLVLLLCVAAKSMESMTTSWVNFVFTFRIVKKKPPSAIISIALLASYFQAKVLFLVYVPDFGIALS